MQRGAIGGGEIEAVGVAFAESKLGRFCRKENGAESEDSAEGEKWVTAASHPITEECVVLPWKSRVELFGQA